MTVVKFSNPLVYKTGRWDQHSTSWWPGTGFKCFLRGEQIPKKVVVGFGERTSQGVEIAWSGDGMEWQKRKVSQGVQELSLEHLHWEESNGVYCWRVNVTGWEHNRIQVENVEFEGDYELVQPRTSDLVFEFIGDSLTAGQYLSDGVLSSDDFLNPCVILTSIEAGLGKQARYFGPLAANAKLRGGEGLSHLYHTVQDSCVDRYASPFIVDVEAFDPSKYGQPVTHIFINIGSNDASVVARVPPEEYLQTYVVFLRRLRGYYPSQTIVLMRLWGWYDHNKGKEVPQLLPIYEGKLEEAIAAREAEGDNNIRFMNTVSNSMPSRKAIKEYPLLQTGWMEKEDFSREHGHPTDEAQKKAGHLASEWVKQNLGVE
ncbi:hypothetical protein BT69DRAFT_1333131 [Atractiella rhizophila]|nr:hypothetical protein BT69DRAFT_1333131 [Atractiella rhizophila]